MAGARRERQRGHPAEAARRRRYGRLRTVVTGPDGRLWVVTSNTFRGQPAADDDRVIILPPSVG